MKAVNMTDYKDGEDDLELESYPRIEIEEITNGWLVTLEDSDGDEYRYAYDTTCIGDLISLLKSCLGA